MSKPTHDTLVKRMAREAHLRNVYSMLAAVPIMLLLVAGVMLASNGYHVLSWLCFGLLAIGGIAFSYWYTHRLIHKHQVWPPDSEMGRKLRVENRLLVFKAIVCSPLAVFLVLGVVMFQYGRYWEAMSCAALAVLYMVLLIAYVIMRTGATKRKL